jgi:hypothetical protein
MSSLDFHLLFNMIGSSLARFVSKKIFLVKCRLVCCTLLKAKDANGYPIVFFGSAN